MTAEEIRVGLVGFGYVSKTFHVPLIRATEGYRIAAVASSRPDDVKAALSDVDVVDDPKDLMRDDIDLVVIASPNDTHAMLAEMAMRAGRNVVVEKPFTIATAEARHLAAISTETGTLLSVFQNRRWDSDFLTVQAAMQNDLIGRISQFESRERILAPAPDYCMISVLISSTRRFSCSEFRTACRRSSRGSAMVQRLTISFSSQCDTAK